MPLCDDGAVGEEIRSLGTRLGQTVLTGCPDITPGYVSPAQPSPAQRGAQPTARREESRLSYALSASA